MPTASSTPNRAASPIAVLRERAGLTQVQLAVRADCSRASVALLEAGYKPKHSEVLCRVYAVLRPYKGDDPAGNRVDAKECDVTAHHRHD